MNLLQPLFGLPVGPELILIVLVIVLLFGANKLPKLARSAGQSINEFQKGKEQAEQELEEIREGVEEEINEGLEQEQE